jgi:hypothetical protein
MKLMSEEQSKEDRLDQESLDDLNSRQPEE